jgi:hypothetical protein
MDRARRRLETEGLVPSRPRDAATAHEFINDVAGRLKQTDGRILEELENHAATVALYFMCYNFAGCIRRSAWTPAMEAGLADHVWAIEEIVALLW